MKYAEPGMTPLLRSGPRFKVKHQDRKLGCDSVIFHQIEIPLFNV